MLFLLHLHLHRWVDQAHDLLIEFEARVEVNLLNFLSFQQRCLTVPRWKRCIYLCRRCHISRHLKVGLLGLIAHLQLRRLASSRCISFPRCIWVKLLAVTLDELGWHAVIAPIVVVIIDSSFGRNNVIFKLYHRRFSRVRSWREKDFALFGLFWFRGMSVALDLGTDLRDYLL